MCKFIIDMTKVRYFFKKKNENEGTVYIIIPKIKLRITSKIVIPNKFWYKGTVVKHTLAIEKLNKITKKIKDLPIDFLTKENVKSIINGDEVFKSTTTTIYSYINTYINIKEKRVKSTNNILMALNFFKKVITPQTTIVDKTIIDNLNDMIIDSNYQPQTLSMWVSNIRSFLKWLNIENGDNGYRYKIERIKYEANEIIALNKDELLRLINIDLVDSPRLDFIRNLYLLGVYSGQRYSDLIKLIEGVVDNGVIRFVQMKTKVPLSIRVTPRMDDIINKIKQVDYTVCNNKIKNTYINVGLKIIIKKLNIERTVFFRGDYVRLDKVVTFHSSRKTFITRSLIKNIPHHIVMQISGHKDYKSFEKYIANASSEIKLYNDKFDEV